MIKLISNAFFLCACFVFKAKDTDLPGMGVLFFRSNPELVPYPHFFLNFRKKLIVSFATGKW